MGKAVEADVHKCIHTLCSRLAREAEDSSIPVDDLSERTQNFYQVFTKRMDASAVYQSMLEFTFIQNSLQIWFMFYFYL